MTNVPAVLIPIVGILLACACKDSTITSQQTARGTAIPVSGDTAADWVQFEDGFVRLSHPKNRKLIVGQPREDIMHAYIVLEPDGDESMLGPETTTMGNASPKEFRNPREIIEDSIRGLANASGRVVNRQRITLARGSCMRLDVEVPMGEQCPVPDGGTADCYQVILSAVCQTPAGVLMKVHSRTLGYPVGKPDARAQEQIKFFDRFLKGIEFK